MANQTEWNMLLAAQRRTEFRALMDEIRAQTDRVTSDPATQRMADLVHARGRRRSLVLNDQKTNLALDSAGVRPDGAPEARNWLASCDVCGSSGHVSVTTRF